MLALLLAVGVVCRHELFTGFFFSFIFFFSSAGWRTERRTIEVIFVFFFFFIFGRRCMHQHQLTDSGCCPLADWLTSIAILGRHLLPGSPEFRSFFIYLFFFNMFFFYYRGIFFFLCTASCIALPSFTEFLDGHLFFGPHPPLTPQSIHAIFCSFIEFSQRLSSMLDPIVRFIEETVSSATFLVAHSFNFSGPSCFRQDVQFH